MGVESARSSNHTRAEDRETGTRPGEEALKGGPVSQSAGETPRRISGGSATSAFLRRQGDGPDGEGGCGTPRPDLKQRGTSRNPREPSRVIATREETVGADSLDEPTAWGTRSED